MFDVGGSDSEPPDSDRTQRVTKDELEHQGLRKQRTTHVGTLEEIERALDEEEAETKRSRQTSPDIDVAIDADDDEGEDDDGDDARAAMFPSIDTEPPASDDEPTKRVPLSVLKAQAEARMARRAAEAAGQPVLLGSAADPMARVTPTPGPQMHAPAQRSPMVSTEGRSGPSLSFTLVIAITAIAAFSAGIFVVRGWGDDTPEPPPAPTPSASIPPADPGPAPTTDAPPSATATAEPTPPPSPTAEPSATAESSAQPSAEAPDELPTPLYKHGLLRVTAPKAGATVYFKGKPAGKVGEILMVPCGAGFVRLGDDPLTKWYNDGRVVAIPCKKELAEVTMTVKPAFR